MKQNKLHIAGQKKGKVCSMSVQLGIHLVLQSVCPSAGLNPHTNQVHTEDSPSESEEWQMLVDPTDLSHQRAVILKNIHSGIFLAVQDGCLTGLTTYNEDCKWFLE